MTDNLSAEDRIREVRISFLRENPFFANISLYLNLIETKNMPMPTMGIDYEGNLYFDPDYVKSLTFSELKGVIAHEVLHLVLQHLLRKGSRDKELFNISCDLAINLILQEQEFRLPRGVLLSDEFQGMCAEEIYDKLYRTAKKIKVHIDGQGNVTIGNMSGKQFDTHYYPKKGEGGNGGSGKKDKDYKGKGEEDNPLSEREIKKLEDEWKKRIVEAQTVAKSMGSMLAGLERMIGTLLEPKINWKALLYRYVTNEIISDVSYSRPHKKSESIGIYFPHTVKENVEIAVAIDSSGSIDEATTNEFISEIVGISRSFANLNMTLLVCDAKVHDVYEIRNGFDPKDVKIRGFGGTNFSPVFQYLEENKPYTKLLIYLTDLMGEFPKSTNIKTLWVVKGGNEKAPFGEVIKYGE
jgi:predicted metal-dependent peptidase